MIKTRNLVILVVVLVVLFGISFLQKSSHRKSTSGSAVTTVLAGELTKDDVGRITVGYGLEGDVVELLADPDGWIVGSAWNAKASEQRIDTLLRNLGDLAGEFRSDSEEVLADYGLGGDTSVRIRAFGPGGDEVLALDVGDKDERSPGNFIKSPDAPAVYLTQGSVLSHLGLYEGPAKPKSSHFIELQAVKEDRMKVDRILLTDENGTLDLAKEFAMTEVAEGDTTGAVPEIDRTTWEWKLTAPETKALAKTKADGVMGALVSVRAVDVDDPGADPADYGLADPAHRATVFFEDGSELNLDFGATREAADDRPAGTWMKVDGEPTIWVVTEYAVTNAFKELGDLLPDQ